MDIMPTSFTYYGLELLLLVYTVELLIIHVMPALLVRAECIRPR